MSIFLELTSTKRWDDGNLVPCVEDELLIPKGYVLLTNGKDNLIFYISKTEKNIEINEIDLLLQQIPGFFGLDSAERILRTSQNARGWGLHPQNGY